MGVVSKPPLVPLLVGGQVVLTKSEGLPLDTITHLAGVLELGLELSNMYTFCTLSRQLRFQELVSPLNLVKLVMGRIENYSEGENQKPLAPFILSCSSFTHLLLMYICLFNDLYHYLSVIILYLVSSRTPAVSPVHAALSLDSSLPSLAAIPPFFGCCRCRLLACLR